MAVDNANPIVHASAGPSRRSKKRFDALDLSDDDEWDRRGRNLDGDLFDEGGEEEIDREEIYGQWRSRNGRTGGPRACFSGCPLVELCMV